MADFLFKERDSSTLLIGKGVIGKEGQENGDLLFHARPFSQEIPSTFCVQKVRREPWSESLVARPYSWTAPHIVRHLPEKSIWREQVTAALQHIKQGLFEKVVLARKTELKWDIAPDPLQLFHYMASRSANTHLYMVKQKKAIWMGASPELLYRRQGRHIEVECVAGTALDPSLLQEKEHREQRPVEQMMRQRLAPFCRGELLSSPLKACQAGPLYHLAQKIEGELSANTTDGTTDEMLLAALHPTPAVAGHPRDAALSFLSETEPFSRELYAGVIGWQSRDAASFVVMLRCLKLMGNRGELFAGVGIVAGSDPDAEWEELERKIGIWTL